jgi:hypothetical protein
MSIWPLVRRLEIAGFHFALEDGHLRVGPASKLPPEDRQVLQADRVELIQAIQEDAQVLRVERAAILEYEAGFSRAEAERMAGLPSSPDLERNAS